MENYQCTVQYLKCLKQLSKYKPKPKINMEAKIFQDTLAGAEREAMLEANSYGNEEMPVEKHFKDDEINDMRRTHMKNSIEIKKKLEEFKIFKQEVDAFIKPLAEENMYLLQNVRNGFVEINQQVYLFEDQENGMMLYYDNSGELVKSRKMLPHERQSKIKQNNLA